MFTSAQDRHQNPPAGPGLTAAAPPRRRTGSVPSSRPALRTTTRFLPLREGPEDLLGTKAAG